MLMKILLKEYLSKIGVLLVSAMDSLIGFITLCTISWSKWTYDCSVLINSLKYFDVGPSTMHALGVLTRVLS